MINVKDLIKFKEMAKRYGDEPSCFVCHPDTQSEIHKNLLELSKETIINPTFWGLPILTFPFIPKDRIYMFSKDMVDRIRETIGEMLG